MEVINNVVVLDKNMLHKTNIGSKKLDKDAFNDILTESRVVTANYGSYEFNKILGLASNLRVVSNKLIADFHVYDVNGFDTELTPFLVEGLSTKAFILLPLINILELNGDTIMKADIVNLGVVMG